MTAQLVAHPDQSLAAAERAARQEASISRRNGGIRRSNPQRLGIAPR
jgi:hypothetical protein